MKFTTPNKTFLNLDNIKIIFWDFDGVIKDSVSVKTDAFAELFKPYGKMICRKIIAHHVENGGMSRFEKIPLYLKWSGIRYSKKKVETISSNFSDIVVNKVINSKWVPGVKNFIRNYFDKYIFIMVSATPQSEIENITKALRINRYFTKIYGSPISKFNIIKKSIEEFDLSPNHCLMFGDAKADIEAAMNNQISFIFRRHKHNINLKINSKIKSIDNFIEINNLFKSI